MNNKRIHNLIDFMFQYSVTTGMLWVLLYGIRAGASEGWYSYPRPDSFEFGWHSIVVMFIVVYLSRMLSGPMIPYNENENEKKDPWSVKGEHHKNHTTGDKSDLTKNPLEQ